MTESESLGAFERHFRGEKARQMRPDGAGLGLSIAQAIIVAHDGQIDLKNNVLYDANGTCVASGGVRATIMLPLLQVPETAQTIQDKKHAIQRIAENELA